MLPLSDYYVMPLCPLSGAASFIIVVDKFFEGEDLWIGHRFFSRLPIGKSRYSP
jgi:hypothetical protein